MDINTGVEIAIDDPITNPLVNLTAAALTNLTSVVNGTNTTTALVPFPQNTTIPWDDQEAMNDLFQAWLRLEKLPPSTMIAQGVAATVFFFVYAIMSYAFWYVLATIATSEAPQAVIVHKNDTSRSSKKDDDYDEEQDQTRYEWPYTSNLRKLLSRLISQAGPTSVLRGIVCLVMVGLFGVLTLIPVIKLLHFLLDFLPGTPDTHASEQGIDGGVLETGWKSAAFTGFVLDGIAHTLVGIILSPADTTHTHIVVTVHSYRTWLRRIPPLFSTIRHLALANAVATVVNQTNGHLPHFLSWLFGITHHFSEVKGWWQSLLFAIMFCFVWTFRIAVKLPVFLALRRMQISSLKEEEETLIPVDRSFGTSGKEERTEGYTAPGILARPHEKVTFVQASRSLVGTKEARRAYVQLLILFAKMVALQLGLALISYPVTGWVDVLLPSAWWDPGPEIF